MAKEENWHRRHAIMLAGQLPDDKEDALTVLRLATQLVTDFLESDQADKPPAPVIALVRGPECA
ncbi:hypothetical protein V1277_006294 [Bradyrhizobium sp. AZCC 1588]|uniref:hypothetical protein n=1 Tax=unclassified Bradyrhizobium TaxID=2631580 RepID=UPI002FEECA77